MDPLARAIEAFQEGNHQRAIMQLTQIVFDDPNNWAARFYLAMAYVASGDQKQGVRQFYQIYLKCPHPEFRQKAKGVLPEALIKEADIERQSEEEMGWQR